MSYPAMSTSVPWSLVKGGFRKGPIFQSLRQKTAAGGVSTLAMQPYARWGFEVDLNAVLGGEAVAGSVLQSFLGCYLATAGAGGYFLFTDPNDNTVSTVEGCMLNVTPGVGTPQRQTGDGSATQFQLGRNIGQGVDVFQNVAGLVVKDNGVTKALGTDYSVSTTGVITWVVAPAAGHALTWSGTFQYLCLFTDDTLKSLARVNKNASGFLWECSSIQFESFFQ